MPGAALSLAFFLSGAAGLIFQVVWFHRAGLVFGSSVTSLTVVLSAFMAGLALGNGLAARSRFARFRSLESYALLEVIVAVSGVLVTFALPFASSVLVAATHLIDSAVVLNALRLAGAFVLLAVPATTMGATLPVVVGALSERGGTYGSVLGRLYGWNTAGAVAGVLAADVVLVAMFGVRNTSLAAAGLDLVAAGLAWNLRRPLSQGTTSMPRPFMHRSNASRHTAIRLPWLAGAAGAIVLALEVVWFRFLTLFVLSTTLAASLMVAAVLGGIAIGGFAAGGWLRAERRAIGLVPWLAAAAMVVTVATFVAFQWTTSGTQVESWQHVLWFAVALAAPTAAISGALFTALGDAFKEQVGDSVSATAQLALSNTVGALVGPGVAGFVLLPALGIERTLLLLALAYGVVAMVALGAARSTAMTPRRSLLAIAALVLATLVLFPYGVTARAYFSRAASAYAGDGSTVVRTSEGVSETIFLMEQRWHDEPIYHRLVTNGFSMTGTGIPGKRYMRAFAYLPMLLHGTPIENALLICYGVGVTADAVLQLPSLTSLDVAEISPDIVAMSDAIYDGAKHPLKDPRARLHLEDGRFFLRSTAQRFDLITGEPPPPRTPGAVNIYTEEYFQLLRDRLNPGGIVSYWLPVARPNPGTDVDTIIRAFCNVFDDCTLWNATPFDFMLIGTRDAPGHLDAGTFAAPWVTPGLQASLREVGFERPEQIGATFLGDSAYLAELTRQTPALTDDYPQRLRPSARASLSDPNYGTRADVRAHYERLMNTDRARAAFQASPFIDRFWPSELKAKTLVYFDYQRMLNDALWDGGKPIAHIEDLHKVLTQTTLRTLPLWMLGTDDVKVRVASAHDEGNGAMEYARGLRGLSGRDYALSLSMFDAAINRGLATPEIPALRALSAKLLH